MSVCSNDIEITQIIFILFCLEEAMCTHNPCKNGGTCTEIEKGFQCSCARGFRGKTCQGEEHAETEKNEKDL